ncbi:glycosyltransferase family A protein [Enorma burkinafasonensis]|uniref:glycosyltransferase family A protein n=1 Tax=Enorma burkinafasonensis TaxID=2590867 RepID=UPI001FEA86C3|nr:glycosyltransferase family A protein [Enorma burkinafasonensis]
MPNMSTAQSFTRNRHTFAICAYGESPYLAECIESLRAQSDNCSDIFLATSTPNDWIRSTAERYDLPLYINEGDSGIGNDWNFAYSMAHTQYITIAHQDDIYLPDYAKNAVYELNSDPYALLFFTNYGEVRGKKVVTENTLLNVKRLLLKPIESKQKSHKTWRKRAILRFGSSICCPSVTFNAERCPRPPFTTQMSSNLDWDTWEHMSRLDGSFIYDKRILVYHRIHEGSATSKLIANNKRNEEDLLMLQRFWPRPLARLIERAYSRGTASNEL